MTKAIEAAVAKYERASAEASAAATRIGKLDGSAAWTQGVADSAAHIVAMLVREHIKNGSTK